MSNTHVQEPAPRARSRNRWLRWIVVAGVASLAIPVGVYIYLDYAHEQELRDAIAEADRLDPGWRHVDLEAARAAVPDAENAASLVLAAGALIPPKWGWPPPNGTPQLEDRVAELPPPERLGDADLNELRTELAKVAAALEEGTRTCGSAARPLCGAVVARPDRHALPALRRDARGGPRADPRRPAARRAATSTAPCGRARPR